MSFFIDGTGLLEVAKGNKKLEKYLDKEVVTSAEQLGAFYSIIAKKYSEKVAQLFFRNIKQVVVEVPTDYIPSAHAFLEEHFNTKTQKKSKKNGVSLIDARDYVYATKNKLLFITGNSSLKGLKDIIFCK